jgi:myo-inositol 2-dehydrogenase / D-chiro-inositol 1-dehydrogenase
LKKINVGVIGLGRIGKLHADNVLKFIPDLQLQAVADVNLDEAWYCERNINKAYSAPEPIIEDPDIDAVLICSPTPTHVPLIISAAKAGKHIFCEKPVALEIDAIQQALDVVNETGITFQIGFNRRFDPNFKKIHQAVVDGEVGAPHLVRITSYDPAPPPPEYVAQSGGIFLDMSIHDFDMARYLAGSEIVEIFATGGVLVNKWIGEAGDVDTAIIQLKFANGALGVIDNCRQAAYGYDQRVEVFGAKGNISAHNKTPTNTVLSTAEGVVADKPHHFFLERYQDSYIGELQAFADSITQQKPSITDPKDGLMAARVALAAKQSFEAHQTIKLD